MASWLPVLLPLLLAGPALGNEGAAAGACGCPNVSSEKPGKLRKYSERMSFWETCMGRVKFTFPQGDIYCGWERSDWVKEVKKAHPEKEKGAVMPSPSHGPPKPALTSAPKTSTSRASLSAQPPTLSQRVVLDETLAMHPAPEVPKDTAQPPAPEVPKDATQPPAPEVPKDATQPPAPEVPKDATQPPAPEVPKDTTQPPASTRSPAPPSHDPVAARPASQAPHVAERGVSPTVVLSLLAVTLGALAVATIVVCQRRHRRRVTLLPHRDPEEHLHLSYREET